MKDYDRSVVGWEIGRAKMVLTAITLGFAGIIAAAGTASTSGLGNQLASLFVAFVSIAGVAVCLRAARGEANQPAAGPRQVRVPATAYRLDIFNVGSPTV